MTYMLHMPVPANMPAQGLVFHHGQPLRGGESTPSGDAPGASSPEEALTSAFQLPGYTPEPDPEFAAPSPAQSEQPRKLGLGALLAAGGVGDVIEEGGMNRVTIGQTNASMTANVGKRRGESNNQTVGELAFAAVLPELSIADLTALAAGQRLPQVEQTLTDYFHSEPKLWDYVQWATSGYLTRMAQAAEAARNAPRLDSADHAARANRLGALSAGRRRAEQQLAPDEPPTVTIDEEVTAVLGPAYKPFVVPSDQPLERRIPGVAMEQVTRGGLTEEEETLLLDFTAANQDDRVTDRLDIGWGTPTDTEPPTEVLRTPIGGPSLEGFAHAHWGPETSQTARTPRRSWWSFNNKAKPPKHYRKTP